MSINNKYLHLNSATFYCFNNFKNIKLQKFYLVISFFCIIISTNELSSQEHEEETYEKLFENVAKNTFLNEDLDKLEYYRNNPVFLRYCSANELGKIPGINHSTADNIIRFVRKNTNLSMKMLNDSLNFTISEYNIILNCTSFAIDKSMENFHKVNIRVRHQTNIQQRKGFLDSSFRGDELDLYQRVKYTSKNITANFLTDKSTGEKSITDFMSGNISYFNDNAKVIVGDYTASVGLGTLLWRQFGATKGSEVFYPVTQTGNGASQYSSSIEFNFFRGIAINYNTLSNLKFSAGYSNIDRAATIDETTQIATSVYNSGYFRTDTEISKRNKLNEQMGFLNVEATSGKSSIGVLGLFLKYDKPIEGQSSTLIKGNGGFFSSYYYRYSSEILNSMAELSADNLGNIALKSFLTLDYKTFRFVIHPRYFSDKFRSMFGSNFGEFSYLSNEFGVYTGVQWKISNSSQLAFYFDKYASLNRTFTVPFIVSGADLLAEYNIKNESGTDYTFRIKNESKTQAMSLITKERIVYNQSNLYLRLDIANKLSQKLNLEQRIEICFVDYEGIKDKETGFLYFCELNYQLSKAFKIGGRISYYSTDSFESTIWQFEYSMPGLMTTYANYGQGTRFYANIIYEPIEELIFRLRYSNTTKNDINIIGTGLYEIKGNAEDRLYLQLDLKL